jgi:hypothetical protein
MDRGAGVKKGDYVSESKTWPRKIPLNPPFSKGELLPTVFVFRKEGLGEICERGGVEIMQRTSESPHTSAFLKNVRNAWNPSCFVRLTERKIVNDFEFS